MTVTLQLAKDHLRIRQDDQNDLIYSHMDSARAAVVKFIGAEPDAYEDDVTAAELLLIEWFFRPADKVDLDENYALPRAVVSLLMPMRLPRVA